VQAGRRTERLGQRLLGGEAGGERGDAPAPAAGQQQLALAIPGVRLSDAANRSISATSIPTPMMLMASTLRVVGALT